MQIERFRSNTKPLMSIEQSHIQILNTSFGLRPVWVAQTCRYFSKLGFMIQRPTIFSTIWASSVMSLIWYNLVVNEKPGHVLPFFRNGTKMHASAPISRREIMIWWHADAVVSSKRGGTPFCIYLERERGERRRGGERKGDPASSK